MLDSPIAIREFLSPVHRRTAETSVDAQVNSVPSAFVHGAVLSHQQLTACVKTGQRLGASRTVKHFNHKFSAQIRYPGWTISAPTESGILPPSSEDSVGPPRECVRASIGDHFLVFRLFRVPRRRREEKVPHQNLFHQEDSFSRVEVYVCMCAG